MAPTDERLTNLEQQFAVTMTKVDLALAELKEQREDIRRAQEKHDADIKAIYQKFDETDKKIDSKFDKLSEQIHNLTIAAVVGFGAIAVAVGGLVFTAFK